MGTVKRRVTYRIYPTKRQRLKLEEITQLHCELYNAALEERRDAYRKKRISMSYVAQANQLPEIKEIRPELIPLGAHALQATLKRLDLAFAAFFRRVKAGQTPGYPRFKSAHRYSGWTYPDHNSWKIEQAAPGKHGHLVLKGIGVFKLRGQARTWGELRTLTVTRKDGRWYASVVVDCIPTRQTGDEATGLDWGVESFATFSDGKRIENPCILARAKTHLVKAQRSLSRKIGPWGCRKPSRNWLKAKTQVSVLHRKVANRRTEFLHQQSAALVNRFSWIATEKLQIAGMTASARGTIEKPGKNVKQKAGLNRAILDTAPSAFLAMLAYKAEEAGGVLAWVDTRKWKPSQTCPECWRVVKKPLGQRMHICECGCVMHRDHASALVQLKVSLGLTGREPALCGGSIPLPSKHETTSKAESFWGV